MEGQIGQKRQDQVSVVAVVTAQVLGVPGRGLFEGGEDGRGLTGREYVDRGEPAVTPVPGNLLVGEYRHGRGR